MRIKNHQKFRLENQIEGLKNVPERGTQATAFGRAKYLAEAARLRREPARKLKIFNQPAWRFAMALLIVLVVVFAGSEGAVNAAQESIPGEPLYPVKLVSEDTRLALTNNPEEKINLLMQFATTRVTEMVKLSEQQLSIPEKTTERMEEHTRLAMELAAGLEDEALKASLDKIRGRLREQAQLMNQVVNEGDGLVKQAQERLERTIQLMDDGIKNPEQFRRQMRTAIEDSTLISTDATATDTGEGPGTPGGTGGTPEPGKGPGPSEPSSGPEETPGHNGP